MAGTQDPREQDPFPTTGWGHRETELPYASTDFTVPVGLTRDEWW
jgi:hypothetical protein